jgi:hypothetical protein
MAGQVNMQRAKIKQGRTKIFFQFIFLSAFVLHRGNQRAPVCKWNIECFHEQLDNSRKGTKLAIVLSVKFSVLTGMIAAQLMYKIHILPNCLLINSYGTIYTGSVGE